MPFVYMLECRDGSFYTGWTTDLEKRLLTHQAGKGGHYTRSHLPVRLVYSEEHPTKSDCLKREAEIKKLPRLKKQALCMKENQQEQANL